MTLANGFRLSAASGNSLSLSGAIGETGGVRTVTSTDAGTVSFPAAMEILSPAGGVMSL